MLQILDEQIYYEVISSLVQVNIPEAEAEQEI